MVGSVRWTPSQNVRVSRYQWIDLGHGGKGLEEGSLVLRRELAAEVSATVLRRYTCCPCWSADEILGSWAKKRAGHWPHSCHACDPWIHNR